MEHTREDITVEQLEDMLNEEHCQVVHNAPSWPRSTCSHKPVARLYMTCVDATGYMCLNMVQLVAAQGERQCECHRPVKDCYKILPL